MKMGEKKTCINKDFHVHHVTNTLLMKNQYALQNDYLRCIDLPQVGESGLFIHFNSGWNIISSLLVYLFIFWINTRASITILRNQLRLKCEKTTCVYFSDDRLCVLKSYTGTWTDCPDLSLLIHSTSSSVSKASIKTKSIS